MLTDTLYIRLRYDLIYIDSSYISAVFMLSVLSTESTSSSGTFDSVTSLRTSFFLKPAARTQLARSI